MAVAAVVFATMNVVGSPEFTVKGRVVVFRKATVAEILSLRHEVLRPGRPVETAHFPGDEEPSAVHFGAFALGADGQHEEPGALGCLSFLLTTREGAPAWQLRGMATSPSVLRCGVGSRLLACAEAYLKREAGTSSPPVVSLWANARVSALGFYAHEGWAEQGGPFEVAGIGPHVVITKQLLIPAGNS